MRKKRIIILVILLIVVIISIFLYLQFSTDWEEDKFVGEWTDPDLVGENWAFFPDRSFAIQISGIWRNDGAYDIKGEKLLITLPEYRGLEEYYYIFSNGNKTLTLYLKEPPTDIYRVYNKSVD